MFLVVVSPWIYRGCFQDADPIQIAIGTERGLANGTLFHEPLLYRPAAHPLYYGLLFLASPLRAGRIDPLIAQMNRLSWLAMGLGLGVLYLICRRLAPTGPSLLIVAGIASCPTILALGTYGHPASVGLLVFLLGTLCLLRSVADDRAGRARVVGWWLLATILLAASVAIRAHVVFLFAAPLALCVAVGARPGRAFLSGAAALGLAGIAYALLAGVLFGPAEATPLQQLATFVETYYRPRSIHLGLVLGAYALGPGLSLLVAAAGLWLVIRKDWSALVLAAACFLPAFVFWTGHPLPLRHFMHAIVGAAFLLAVAAQRRRGSGRLGTTLGVLAVTLLNLGLTPAVGALVDAAGYRREGTLAALTTSVVESHRIRQRYWDWERERWRERAAARPDGTLFIGRYYELMGMMLAAVRMGEARIHTEGSEDLWVVRMGDRRFYFLGWDGRTPDDARRQREALRRVAVSEVRIVAPYAPDELRTMPPGVADLAPERLRYHPIE